MNPSTCRAVVNEPAAWALLTANQRMVVQLATRPTADGKRRCVRGICKGLGISHQSFYRCLRRAGTTFEAIVAALDRDDLGQG